MTANTTYRANKGSIAYRVISFLVANKEEFLTIEDIVIKFDADTNSIKSLLVKAIKVGALKAEKNVFSLGNMATAQQAIGGDDGKPIVTRTPAAPEPAPHSSPRQSIDDATGEEWNAAAANLRRDDAVCAPTITIGAIKIQITAEQTPVCAAPRLTWQDLIIALVQARLASGGASIPTARVPAKYAKSIKSALSRWRLVSEDKVLASSKITVWTINDTTVVQCPRAHSIGKTV